MADNKQSGSAAKVKVTLTRSLIGRPEKHRKVAYGLGLKKLHNPVEVYDTPTIRGMITKISHLVTVEAV